MSVLFVGVRALPTRPLPCVFLYVDLPNFADGIALGGNPHPVKVTRRDNGDDVRAFLYSYHNTITEGST